MSFFFVGRSPRNDIQGQIKDIFCGLKFIVGNKDLTISSDDSFVYCRTPPKVIDDIFIKLCDSASWVLLVGAPVISAKTDDERQYFAKELFKNPQSVLRKHIDGHYAVLAFDAVSNSFLAASDWNSLIPVYFAITEEGPMFCNAELPLAKLLQCKPDDFGFAQAIHYGTTWGDRTRFDGIRKLETCELIRIDVENKLKREKYWEPHMEKLWKGSFDDISHRWLEVMRDTIHVFADQRNGSGLSSDLTAGEDSRLIVALLHELNVPFKVRVAGGEKDLDVTIAKKIAETVGLDLAIEDSHPINMDELSSYTETIITHSDCYHSFFTNALFFVNELHYRPKEFENIHLCGLPGGPQFRGADYWRAKLLFPSSYNSFDYRAYARRRFLLDYTSDLLKFSDNEYFEGTYGVIKDALEEVEGFPSGIQVDHLMRVRYGCLLTAHTKRPFYFAFAPRDMTRSTYNVPPSMKQGGGQYKAITEMLWPELAWIRTQAGVPTVRKTFLRKPLFIPEHYSRIKKAFKGIARQKLKKATALRAKSDVNARHHTLAFHKNSIRWLFGTEPYASWFKSAETMMSGNYYNPTRLNELLLKAQQPDFDQVQLFGRIVSQEMALRKVYGSI